MVANLSLFTNVIHLKFPILGFVQEKGLFGFRSASGLGGLNE